MLTASGMKEFEEQEREMAVKITCGYLRNSGFSRAQAIGILHRAEECILKEMLEEEKEDKK